jgi:hypothetical protein
MFDTMMSLVATLMVETSSFQRVSLQIKYVSNNSVASMMAPEMCHWQGLHSRLSTVRVCLQ